MAEGDDPTVPAVRDVEREQEEANEENSVHKRELTWKCGEAYQYAIPQPDGDPWEELLTFLMVEERKRCKSLSDDIQLSLVVAALFSAVVVSILISQKPLMPGDPQDTTNYLLFRLVTITESIANASLVAIPLDPWQQFYNSSAPQFYLPDSGGYSQSVICIWFTMVAVIVGISALQWLNAYETYPKATPKQKFTLLSMRRASFKTWRVPLFVRLLPVLLLFSLCIFTLAFNGLVIPYVYSLQYFVGHVLTFGVFLLTFMPALEEYMLHFPGATPFLQAGIQAPPCPYRSIQANMLRCIVNWRITRYMFLPCVFALMIPVYYFWAVVTISKSLFSGKVMPTAPNLESPYHASNWPALDWKWLMIRWTHFTELYDTYLQVEPRSRDLTGLHFDDRLLYDAIEGLIYVAESHVTQPHVLYAAYHCFADLSQGSLGLRSQPQLADTVGSPETIRNNRYIQALLANPTNHLQFHASSLSSAIADPTLQVLHEENMLLFLQAIFTLGAGRMTSEQSPNPIWPPAFSSTHLLIISQHLAELHVRVKGYFYNDLLFTSSSPFFAENHNLLPRQDDGSIVYFYQYVEDAEAKKAFTQNYLAMLSNILEECGREWQLELRMGALLTHSNLYHLILVGARATRYAAYDRARYFSIEQLHGTVFAALRSGLTPFLSQPIRADTAEPGAGSLVSAPGDALNNRSPDLLFYAACIYVQYLAKCGASSGPLMDALDDIIPILRSYRAQCPPNALLERNLGVVFTPQWWSFLAAPRQKNTSGESSGVSASPGLSSVVQQSGARTGMLSIVEVDETNHGAAHTVNRVIVANNSQDSDKDRDEQGRTYPPGTQSVVDDVQGAGVRLLGPHVNSVDSSSRYNLV
ncbi:hypothetical protein D9619_010929 [Psilocybe cf. subviscida]|uniref:DUF6535 domain-containing protein n=1 Tax=Psilocybe cf. subviscida TaxID=2480587 RepID=A0A8H5EZX7_9AGAR|nr:hypothetical protein D9619_010929 [Psilocybe cf. subviscida]